MCASITRCIGRAKLDVLYFLNRRVNFIRQFYEMSSAPFVERKRQIKAGEEPWIPPYSEEPEPAFLKEWQEADESLQVVGRTCISMLSAAFHLYFKAWEREIGIPVDGSLKAVFKKKGWFNGYKAYFLHHCGIDFEDSPSELAILEEIVLVRNRDQHPESIMMDSSYYLTSDLEKLPHPFFISERDASLFSVAEANERFWLMPPLIRIAPEKFFAALSEVERFAAWLESIAVQL